MSELVDDDAARGRLALASPSGPSSHVTAVIDAWAQTIASPGTRRTYQAAVLAIVAAHGAITADSLAAWRDELAARGRARTTIRAHIAAARAFADWAARVGQLDPAAATALRAVEPPTVRGEHAPRALPDTHVRLMDTHAASAWPDDPLRALQARALLSVLSGCGLRVAELGNARQRHLTAARPSWADRAQAEGRPGAAGKVLDVEGKGGRRRTVPVPARTVKILDALHAQLGTRGQKGAALIPALTNHRPARPVGATQAITERRVRKVLLVLAQAVNEHTQTTTIDADDVHPHALRHAYALRYLREHPGSLGRLRELLGHADIATTAKYLAAITDDGPPIDAWTGGR